MWISLSNLAEMLIMVRRWAPIDFGGQRSKVKVTMDIYGNKLVNNDIDKTVVCFLIKLGRHSHGERMNPIDFG